jgi:hypothetical protein
MVSAAQVDTARHRNAHTRARWDRQLHPRRRRRRFVWPIELARVPAGRHCAGLPERPRTVARAGAGRCLRVLGTEGGRALTQPSPRAHTAPLGRWSSRGRVARSRPTCRMHSRCPGSRCAFHRSAHSARGSPAGRSAQAPGSTVAWLFPYVPGVPFGQAVDAERIFYIVRRAAPRGRVLVADMRAKASIALSVPIGAIPGTSPTLSVRAALAGDSDGAASARGAAAERGADCCRNRDCNGPQQCERWVPHPSHRMTRRCCSRRVPRHLRDLACHGAGIGGARTGA